MSIYAEQTIGTADNQILFNNDAETPYYRVETRQPQARQLREIDLPLPFESGIADWRTLIGKMGEVISGVMYPDDEDGADLGIRKLRKLASLDIEQNDPASDMGYVPYVFGEVAGSFKQIFLKVLYVNLVESASKGIVQPFQLVCKIKDPTIYGTTPRVASSQGVDPTLGSGTAIYPFAYPIIFGSSQYSVNSTITNEGDLPTYPTGTTIVGPVNNPILTNELTGEFIRVGVNLNSSSDILNIFYNQDTKTVELNGVSVLNQVSDDSTFFKIRPGANPITMAGDSVGSGGYFEVSCLDAYPLS